MLALRLKSKVRVSPKAGTRPLVGQVQRYKIYLINEIPFPIFVTPFLRLVIFLYIQIPHYVGICIFFLEKTIWQAISNSEKKSQLHVNS